MRHLILAASLALSIGSPRPAAAQGSEPHWTWWVKPAAQPAQGRPQTAIIDFSGRLAVSRAGLPKSLEVQKAPFMLQEGDVVRTSGDGSAILRMKDRSQVRLDAGSEFALREESPDGVSLVLFIGKLWAQVAKGRTRPFKVWSPESVAAVRGTSFSVEVTAARKGITEVYEGAVAVEALNNGAPSGPETLLLAGQRIEASGGRLGEMRPILKPADSQGPRNHAPKEKAELEKRLETLTAAADAEHDADKAAAASAARRSGDVSKMRAVAQTLEAAPNMTPEQKALLAKAFDKGRSLSDVSASFDRANSEVLEQRRQVSEAMTNWNVNRELGLQLQDQASRSQMAKGAISASASQASAQVTMAAYQQQYTQSYLGSQQALEQALGRSAQGAPLMTSVSAPVMAAIQMPSQAAVNILAATSPSSPVNQTAPVTTNPTNLLQTAPILAPPTGSGTCLCTLLGCLCH